MQSVTASKKYLWNYEVVTYTSGTPVSTAPCIIGTYGDTGATGNGISSIKEHYAVSASNTTAPTSWSDTVPTLTATNKYLWNYETITYTSGKSIDTTKRVIGVYGDKGDPGITGGKGDTGLQGCISRTSEWATGVEYRNDESLASGTRYLDIAVVTKANGTFDAYQCKKTHTSSTSIGVTNTTYWQKFSSLPPVYTPLIMAKNSVIRFMQGNQLLIQKENGEVTAGASGQGEGSNGIRFWAGAAEPRNAPFRVDENGKLVSTDAELINIILQGSIRSPFVRETDSIDIVIDNTGQSFVLKSTHDNVVPINDSGGWVTAGQLQWDTSQSGREICLVNYKWKNVISLGNVTYTAPNGKYFFEDGLLKRNITLNKECVVLKGYGSETEFYGWLVLNRVDVGTTNQYGRVQKVLATGIVTGSASGASIKYKTFDGGKMTVTRTNKGIYAVELPWGIDKYTVFLTGIGSTVDYSDSPIKATLAQIWPGYFAVWTSDDDTRNDGSFNFQVVSMADWDI